MGMAKTLGGGSGGAFNPAVAFGRNIISKQYNTIPTYWIAETLGGVVAGAL